VATPSKTAFLLKACHKRAQQALLTQGEASLLALMSRDTVKFERKSFESEGIAGET
jgi:hypothetical protein